MNLHDTSKTKFTQLRANTDTIFNQMAIKLVISPLLEMLIHVRTTYVFLLDSSRVCLLPKNQNTSNCSVLKVEKRSEKKHLIHFKIQVI